MVNGVPDYPCKLGYGFEQFEEWRPYQKESLERLLASPKRYLILEAPTGAGKSLIYTSLARLLGKRAVATVGTKSLQSQLVRDFPHMVEMKGRANYPCLLLLTLGKEGATAEECLHHSYGKECHLCYETSDNKGLPWLEEQFKRKCAYEARLCLYCPFRNEGCEYYEAKKRALSASFACLNISYFLNEANFAGAFADRDLLILDEADTVENHLRSFISLTISERQLKQWGFKPPAYKTKWESWREWAEEHLGAVQQKLEGATARLRTRNFTLADVKFRVGLERMARRFADFVKLVDQYWVFSSEENDRKWTFKPVLVSDYSGKYLFNHARRVLMTSATICDCRQFCRELGIPEEDTEHIQLPSLFPKEHRPVFYMPITALSRDNEEAEFPKVVEAVDTILDQYPSCKALCHTVSFARAKILLKLSRHSSRMLTHNTKNRLEILEQFMTSSEPLVLVSPSMERGLDLVGDLGRLAIFVKLPYGNLGDPQINKRVYAFPDGSRWYAWETARSLVQGSGRIVRSPSDWGLAFILDAEFSRLYQEYRNLFPLWWRDALHYLDFQKFAQKDRQLVLLGGVKMTHLGA